MRINDAGKALIREFEGCRLESYRCPAGIWTIGYGSTGAHVKPGQVITQRIADDMFAADLRRFEQGVTRLLGDAPTTPGQFAALVSFTFNLGFRALEKSTLFKLHKAGDHEGAAAQFSAWNKARVKGHLVPLAGLTRRRAAEAALYRGDA